MPPVFEVRASEKIRDGMLAWIAGTSTEPTDWLPGSRALTLLESVSIELEELYYQMYRGLTQQLPVVLFDTFGFAALGTQPATGTVTFSRATAAPSNIAIPVGSRVGTLTSESDPARTYRTSVAAYIPTGQTAVTVAAEAEVSGPAGNIAAGKIVAMLTPVTGVDAVSNQAGFSGGRDTETLEDRRERFRDYLATIYRGTPLSLRIAAEGVAGIKSASVVDSPYLYAFVFSGSTAGILGAYTSIADIVNDPGSTGVSPLPSPPRKGDSLYVGAEIRFDLLHVQLRIPGTYASTAGVWEYWDDDTLDTTVGKIGKWLEIPGVQDFSAGLSASDTVKWRLPDVPNWGQRDVNGQIAYWVRFRVTNPDVIAVQSSLGELIASPLPGQVFVYAHDGSGALSDALRVQVTNAVGAYRAAGVKVTVKPPVAKPQDVKITLQVHRGANKATAIADAKAAIANLFSQLRVGQALSIEDASRVVMNANASISDLVWTIPDNRDVPASPEQLIRLGTLTVL